MRSAVKLSCQHRQRPGPDKGLSGSALQKDARIPAYWERPSQYMNTGHIRYMSLALKSNLSKGNDSCFIKLEFVGQMRTMALNTAAGTKSPSKRAVTGHSGGEPRQI